MELNIVRIFPLPYHVRKGLQKSLFCRRRLTFMYQKLVPTSNECCSCCCNGHK